MLKSFLRKLRGIRRDWRLRSAAHCVDTHVLARTSTSRSLLRAGPMARACDPFVDPCAAFRALNGIGSFRQSCSAHWRLHAFFGSIRRSHTRSADVLAARALTLARGHL